MRWPSLLAPVLAAGLALPGPAAAAGSTPEAGILERVAATYRGLDRYWFEGVIEVDIRAARGPQSQRAPFVVARDGKGRFRDEVSSGPAAGLVMSDGREIITYNGMLGQYKRQPGNADSASAEGRDRGVSGAVLGRLETVAAGVREIRRLPDEELVLGAERRRCIVLEVVYEEPVNRVGVTEDPRRYWIDAATHLVLRQRSLLRAEGPQFGGSIEQEETVRFTRARLDGPLPDSLWVFRTPARARQVDEFRTDTEELAASFTGKPAIDFTLQDLEGRSHSLKSLRGKTVLLDFWATWCGPCRFTMPQVAKIHEEYRDRGVEVMSINVGESPAKARDYMKKNGYAFPALLDQDRQVALQYRVNGIPTLIVIDTAGTVVDYMVGARDDRALRAALAKAGVK